MPTTPLVDERSYNALRLTKGLFALYPSLETESDSDGGVDVELDALMSSNMARTWRRCR